MSCENNLHNSWPAVTSAAMVGLDPVQRVAHHVEGPTLLERELPFGRGIASIDRAPTCLSRSTRASAGARPGLLKYKQRSLQAIKAGALTLAAALIAAGCGGGDADAYDPASNVSDQTTEPSMTAGNLASGDSNDADSGLTVAEQVAQDTGANEITEASAESGSVVKISSRTPKIFKKAHCKKPIMVVLHQPGSMLDQILLAEARSAARGMKQVVTIVYTPKDVRSFGDLPAKLGLLAAPGVSIVNRAGEIENFWTTYVDERLIKASLKNAAAATPCAGELPQDELAPPPSPLEDAAALVSGKPLPKRDQPNALDGSAATGIEGTSLATDAAAAPLGDSASPADPAAVPSAPAANADVGAAPAQ